MVYHLISILCRNPKILEKLTAESAVRKGVYNQNFILIIRMRTKRKKEGQPVFIGFLKRQAKNDTTK